MYREWTDNGPIMHRHWTDNASGINVQFTMYNVQRAHGVWYNVLRSVLSVMFVRKPLGRFVICDLLISTVCYCNRTPWALYSLSSFWIRSCPSRRSLVAAGVSEMTVWMPFGLSS